LRKLTRLFRVATYNVHRWGGRTGRTLMPAQAAHVIRELNADILALQEVLLPWGEANPLAVLASALDMHVIFGATRPHRHGLLGNALLSRWHAHHTEQLSLSQTRWEYRGAVLGCYQPWEGLEISVIATHLALQARTRDAQVRWLLTHPCLQHGPVVLLGDLNSWRPTRATRELARTLETPPRRVWPRTFPSSAPLLALDRIYTRELNVVDFKVHSTPAARRGSDHLPVVAHMAA
jgi:endonuclease/exonuclease/phosphatase family metal-dependent hydrolase